MKRLRTMTLSLRLLVALFLAAQFAGVVSSPLAGAHAAPSVLVLHGEHQHAHAHGSDGCAHQDKDRCGDPADHCCALHAFFAGILPLAIAVANEDIFAEPRATHATDVGVGADPDRFDRPPRPFAAI